MASLFCFAAANFFLRERVAAMPLLSRISGSKELTASLLAFRVIDTQKHFSLQDLNMAFNRFTAPIARRRRSSGTLLNLLTCQRACYNCGITKPACVPLPLEGVESRVGLDEIKIKEYRLVLGKVEIPHSKQIKEGTADDPFGEFQKWTTTTTVLSLDALQEPRFGDGEPAVSTFVKPWLPETYLEEVANIHLPRNESGLPEDLDHIVNRLIEMAGRSG